MVVVLAEGGFEELQGLCFPVSSPLCLSQCERNDRGGKGRPGVGVKCREGS